MNRHVREWCEVGLLLSPWLLGALVAWACLMLAGCSSWEPSPDRPAILDLNEAERGRP